MFSSHSIKLQNTIDDLINSNLFYYNRGDNLHQILYKTLIIVLILCITVPTYISLCLNLKNVLTVLFLVFV